jgi:hypothetical protein
MYKLVAAMAVLALIAVPAIAEDGEEILAIGDLYLADDGLWEETNGLEGLQRSETVVDEDTIPADDSILAL